MALLFTKAAPMFYAVSIIAPLKICQLVSELNEVQINAFALNRVLVLPRPGTDCKTKRND